MQGKQGALPNIHEVAAQDVDYENEFWSFHTVVEYLSDTQSEKHADESLSDE